MENLSCDTCPFWANAVSRPVGAGPSGKMFGEMGAGAPRECRAHAPRASAVPVQGQFGGMQMSVMSIHPITAPDHWCGLHPTLEVARHRRNAAAETLAKDDALRLDPATGKFNRVPTPAEFQRMLDESGGKVSTVDVRTGKVQPVVGEDPT